MKTPIAVLGVVALCALAGCATVTGAVSGAFTGAVDAPAETYRHNAQAFEKNPILFGLDALVVAPIGIVTGPLFGFAKGLSLDIQWVIGQVHYGDVFGTYGPTSIWRPHTIKWPTSKPQEPAQ